MAWKPKRGGALRVGHIISLAPGTAYQIACMTPVRSWLARLLFGQAWYADLKPVGIDGREAYGRRRLGITVFQRRSYSTYNPLV